jgi:hypothetical protein
VTGPPCFQKLRPLFIFVSLYIYFRIAIRSARESACESTHTGPRGTDKTDTTPHDFAFGLMK